MALDERRRQSPRFELMKKKSNKGSEKPSENLDVAPTPPGFFGKAVMGKYHGQYVQGRKVVRAVNLEEDVAAVFKDSNSVNKVLRAIITSLPQGNSRKRKKSA